MKTKSLQFGKAMSAALFVLLLNVVGMKNALAQNQVATLQHGEEMSVFYGMNAFVEAHVAAVDGDIITLSSGTFTPTNINKAISLRGAGCAYDSVTYATPTIIPDNCYLRVSDISFEGIWFTGFVGCEAPSDSYYANNISFVKCNINKTGVSSRFYNNAMNWQFINCIIKEFDTSPSTGYHIYCFLGMSVINSVVRFTHYIHTNTYNLTTINNSIVLFDNEQSISNIVAYNSIIATVSGHAISNCTFFNCIGIETGETLLFEGQIAENVMEVDSYEDVFETFVGTVFYDNLYQLKEEVDTSLLGNDGTEVGIYGGMLPYNPRPSYMRIKRCNVAPRSTIDGKLSVDIEVLTDDE
jgi:hypothetical protein